MLKIPKNFPKRPWSRFSDSSSCFFSIATISSRISSSLTSSYSKWIVLQIVDDLSLYSSRANLMPQSIIFPAFRRLNFPKGRLRCLCLFLAQLFSSWRSSSWRSRTDGLTPGNDNHPRGGSSQYWSFSKIRFDQKLLSFRIFFLKMCSKRSVLEAYELIFFENYEILVQSSWLSSTASQDIISS